MTLIRTFTLHIFLTMCTMYMIL